METVYDIDEIEEVAVEIIKAINGKKVIAFHGEMGSGKTTLIRAICQKLGVTDPVSSPTYSLINEYRAGEGSIFHMDLYRLRDKEEVIQAGVEDALFSGNLCLVEWPGLAISLFPDNVVDVYVEATGESTRRIRIGDN